MYRPRLPKTPAESLSPDACDIADFQLSDLMNQLMLNSQLDHHQFNCCAQLLRLSFWQGFWRLAADDPPQAAIELGLAQAALLSFDGLMDEEAVLSAHRRGRMYVFEWAGPNWRPGQN